MERQPYNAAGQCKVTGDYIYEVIRSHNEESPLRGRSIEIGPPNENAERCFFLRIDGSVTQTTICTEALDEGIDLIALNKEITAGLMWETVDTNRLLIGAAPMTPKQRSVSVATIFAMANAPVISLFTREKWADVLLREKVVGNG